MISKILLSIFILLSVSAYSNPDYRIITADINNFWHAYDRLETAKSKQDSINIIQEFYIDKASSGLKVFIRARSFTAEEYIKTISSYPEFWQSIRPLTENIENRKNELRKVFDQLSRELPNYKQPDICFAIGCLRTGGTTSKKLILIGSEIAAADNTVEKSELPTWLKSVVGNTGDITAMVAHETVHTQQYDSRLIILRSSPLLEQVLKEGIADFITYKTLKLNINSELHKYGDQNECQLWQKFESDLKKNPKDYSNWLYNTAKAKGQPGDLGYYIGFKIAESYYHKQTDKRKALATLLNQKKYKMVFKESEYRNESCN